MLEFQGPTGPKILAPAEGWLVTLTSNLASLELGKIKKIIVYQFSHHYRQFGITFVVVWGRKWPQEQSVLLCCLRLPGTQDNTTRIDQSL